MLFRQLKQNLTNDFSALPIRRLALLGDSATQFLAQAIRGYGYEEKINFDILEADFDQVDRQIRDRDSELYHSKPEFIVLYLAAEKLWERFAATEPQARERFAEGVRAEIEHWWITVAEH